MSVLGGGGVLVIYFHLWAQVERIETNREILTMIKSEGEVETCCLQNPRYRSFNISPLGIGQNKVMCMPTIMAA